MTHSRTYFGVAKLSAMFLLLSVVLIAPSDTRAHGNTIDLHTWCKHVHNQGGIKLPFDRKWRARYNTRKKRWDCFLPESKGFNRISPEVVRPLNLVKACRTWGGSKKVHFHEGHNVKSPSAVHCGKFDGTVKRGHDKPTTLRFCNRSAAAKISAAYAYWDRRKGRRGWTAEGWWTVQRGQCKQVTVPGGPSGRPYSGDVYVYGENNSGTWGGQDAGFCVNDRKGFTHVTADKMNCRGGVLKKARMTKFAVKPGRNTWNFR